MKILWLSSYFKPEVYSSLSLDNDLLNAFVDAGYVIEIVTPVPTRGLSKRLRREFKSIFYEEKLNGKVKIHRFSMFKEGKNPIQRALRYILCHFIQFCIGVNLKNVDVVFGGNTSTNSRCVIRNFEENVKKNVYFFWNISTTKTLVTIR